MRPIALLGFVILLFSGCNQPPAPPEPPAPPAPPQPVQEITQGPFVHTVLFWLKNPDNQSDRQKFEASLKKFIDASQYVVSKHLGTPANTPREVVDNSYTYCMVLTFKSKEDQDKYQVEPVHLTFIEESKDLWEKVTVFDSINLW